VQVLPKVAGTLGAWADAVGARSVLLAEPRSFCAGVDRAIEVVERALEQRGAPVYVRKQIVHNQHVVADLHARGARFVNEIDEVPQGETVVFSAHGVSPAVWDNARHRGLDIIDATCPLVSKVHSEVRRFAGRGDTIIFIGHAGHEETEGTMGERPERTVLVENVEDARVVEVENPDQVSYLVQTTLSVHEVEQIVEVLHERFPKLKAPASDDICYATTNRQDSLTAVAADSELVLVVGSQNSSNSQRLVETAQRLGTEAHLVDDADDVDLGWLAGVTKVGLTAGASAPQALVDEVVHALGGLGPVESSTRHLVDENVRFTLPKEVRPA
jgi:4-hydroxy-3-methylbut-2-enyl diphosphate reductase